MSEEGEELIGVAGTVEEVQGFSMGRIRCTNCVKGKHSLPGKDVRCSNTHCECQCLTHYVSADGVHLVPYGMEDKYKNRYDVEDNGRRDHTDDLIDQINKNWNRK